MKKANPAVPKPVFSGGEVTFSVDARAWGEEAVLGAAYLLTDRCWVALDGSRSATLKVGLTPKLRLDAKGLRELAGLFRRELETQRVRWAIAKNNLPVREHVAKQAVLLANGAVPAQPPPAEELSSEQRKEIDDLIAEVEAEIKTLKDKKAGADPKGIAATWEERHRAS